VTVEEQDRAGWSNRWRQVNRWMDGLMGVVVFADDYAGGAEFAAMLLLLLLVLLSRLLLLLLLLSLLLRVRAASSLAGQLEMWAVRFLSAVVLIQHVQAGGARRWGEVVSILRRPATWRL
jgi:hypothetical protein